MTRKDFQLIADTLRGIGNDVCRAEQRDQIAKAFARALKDTNPSFNRNRFLAACDIKEN